MLNICYKKYSLWALSFSVYHEIVRPGPSKTVVFHYGYGIMSVMTSQITSLTIVFSIVYSGADQRKHQSSASVAFVWGIHRWSVNSPHKEPAMRKMFHLMTSSCTRRSWNILRVVWFMCHLNFIMIRTYKRSFGLTVWTDSHTFVYKAIWFCRGGGVGVGGVWVGGGVAGVG